MQMHSYAPNTVEAVESQQPAIFDNCTEADEDDNIEVADDNALALNKVHQEGDSSAETSPEEHMKHLAGSREHVLSNVFISQTIFNDHFPF